MGWEVGIDPDAITGVEQKFPVAPRTCMLPGGMLFITSDETRPLTAFTSATAALPTLSSQVIGTQSKSKGTKGLSDV